jgi:hypothetical protein
MAGHVEVIVFERSDVDLLSVSRDDNLDGI